MVLLLGGPNCYIKGMRDCWKANIPKIWEERNTPLPEGVPPEDLIKTPDNAQYFAAIGSVEFGKTEDDNVGQYIGFEKLEWYVNVGREEEKPKRGGGVGLAKDDAELAAFKEKYRTKKFTPTTFQPGEVVEGFIGIDGGSTSTKAVLMSKDHKRRILAKTYQLSKGNPIEDTIEVLQKLDRADPRPGRRAQDPRRRHHRLRQGHSQGRDRRRRGAGRNRRAHRSRPALLRRRRRDLRRRRPGHQDHHPEERPRQRFQAQHAVFGGQRLLPAIDRAGLQRPGGGVCRHRVRRQGIPRPSATAARCSCSRDIVDFQRQGWKPEEIMAGLCNVLPKNIWLYVSQIPNLSAIGTQFLLQGGTQYNLAAVKAQVDFIESRFKGKEHPAEVIVHEHCGEAGAIGAALEAGRLWDNGRKSAPSSGSTPAPTIAYKTTREEATRCYFCKNKCLRTFIDVKTSDLPSPTTSRPAKTKVPLEAGAQRLIIATCEKGTVENIEEMRGIKGDLDKIKKANPELRRDRRQGGLPRARRAAAWPTRCRSSRSPPRRRSAPS